MKKPMARGEIFSRNGRRIQLTTHMFRGYLVTETLEVSSKKPSNQNSDGISISIPDTFPPWFGNGGRGRNFPK